MKSKYFRTISFCAITATLLGVGVAAQAAAVGEKGSDSQAGRVEEIVVTAQKRSERLQNVPIAVSAATAGKLAAAGLTSTTDLGVVLPGLQMQNAAGYVLPHVRGVGTTATSPSIENSVAVAMDGVYIASPAGSLLSLSNVAQVELLKGPQGTLFGRNATGGVLQITTLEPGDALQAKASLSYDNYDTVTGDAYLSGPIAEGLSADIAGHVSHQGDGYGVNSFNGRDVYQTKLDLALRSKWVLKLGDLTTIHLIGDYEETKGSHLGLNRPVDGTRPLLGVFPIRDAWSINENTQPYASIRSGGGSVRIDQSLGDVKFTSITAYRKAHFRGYFPYDFTPNPGLELDWQIHSRQLTQEFQLQSDSGSPLQWTVGAYYFRAHDFYAPFKVNIGGVFAAARNLAQQIINDDVWTRSIAAFGQATYEFMPDTHVVLGARYTKERRHFTADIAGVRPSGTLIPVLIPSQDKRIRFSEPTWRIALDHRFSPELMGYMSYNRGFKSGGFNPGSPTNLPYDPEKLDAYELGLKADVLDRRLRINPAFFYYTYKNIQVSTYVNTSGVIYNGAAARLYGLDLDFDAAVTDRFTLSGGLEWLHSRFTSFPAAVIATPLPSGGYSQLPGSATGNQLPYAPKFVGTATAIYRVPLSSDSNLNFTATYQYNNGFFTESDNKLRQDSYGILNGSIGWALDDDHFSVKLWGKNITNSKYVLVLATASQGAFETFAPPRTYGVAVGVKF